METFATKVLDNDSHTLGQFNQENP